MKKVPKFKKNEMIFSMIWTKVKLYNLNSLINLININLFAWVQYYLSYKQGKPCYNPEIRAGYANLFLNCFVTSKVSVHNRCNLYSRNLFFIYFKNSL